MACEWSYTRSSINHRPQQTKGFYAFYVPDQLIWPLELKNNSPALSLTIVHEKVSLTCSFRVVWAHSMQQISFPSNTFQIFSLEFNFWPSYQTLQHKINNQCFYLINQMNKKLPLYSQLRSRVSRVNSPSKVGRSATLSLKTTAYCAPLYQSNTGLLYSKPVHWLTPMPTLPTNYSTVACRLNWLILIVTIVGLM